MHLAVIVDHDAIGDRVPTRVDLEMLHALGDRDHGREIPRTRIIMPSCTNAVFGRSVSIRKNETASSSAASETAYCFASSRVANIVSSSRQPVGSSYLVFQFIPPPPITSVGRSRADQAARPAAPRHRRARPRRQATQ